MKLFSKEGEHFGLMAHYQRSFFGLGFGVDRFTGCDDDYTKTYRSYNLKIFIGPIILNILTRGFGKPVKD